MKRSLLTMLITGVFLTGQAAAVAPGMLLEFSNSPMGKVLFDGAVHQAAGFSCQDCHIDWLVQIIKHVTTNITMAEITSGRMCGGCLNWVEAFAPEGNCDRCHIMYVYQ
jgi:c(7)-type cytochrome triheme protein